MLTWSPTLRNNFVAALEEFAGTFLFLLFAFAGTQIAIKPPSATVTAGGTLPPDPANLFYISLVFSMSLTANVLLFTASRVALALFLVGGLSAVRALVVAIAQFLAGIAAAAVASALFPGPMAGETTLGNGTNVAQGLFIETFLTAELVFVVIMVAAEKHKSTYLAPVAIGVALFLAQLVGVYYTGGSLNPARSLGPAVVNRHFPAYFWIYWLGPLLGSLLACGFYALLRGLKWKDCSPGQDWDDIEKLEFERRLDGKGSSSTSETPLSTIGGQRARADTEVQGEA